MLEAIGRLKKYAPAEPLDRQDINTIINTIEALTDSPTYQPTDSVGYGRLDDEGYRDGLLVLQNGALQGFVMVDHCGPDHIILRTETKRGAHHITRDQLYRLAAGILTVLAHVDYPDQK
jgi:hypothetical protein